MGVRGGQFEEYGGGIKGYLVERMREQRRMLYGKFPEILQDQLEMLSISVSNEEIKKAIFDMKPYKAVGPYGYQPFFYHDQQRMVGLAMCNFIRDIS